jgi:DNA-binding MarR family transcriptional regulator
MLELFIREGNGHGVSLDQLAAEEDLPALTAYRCVNLLIDKGFIERKDSQAEQQAVQLSLSPTGRRKMREVLLESAEYASHRCAAQDRGTQTLQGR